MIGAILSPGENVGVPFCVSPWIASDLAGSAVGVTGVIFGVYVVSTAVPFLSLA